MVSIKGKQWAAWLLLGAVLLMAMAGATPASTASPDALSSGGITSQPIGHYDFCRTNPRECAVRPRDRRPLAMTEEVWAFVSRVNREVNDEIVPMSDYDIYGQEEFWAYPDQGVGDCEDYVLEKRRRLTSAGISLANLLITVVRKPDGEGHAVLTLRTNRGDFILDNLNDDLRLWHETGYSFLKRQSKSHTGRWVSLPDDQNMLVGAVR